MVKSKFLPIGYAVTFITPVHGTGFLSDIF